MELASRILWIYPSAVCFNTVFSKVEHWSEVMLNIFLKNFPQFVLFLGFFVAADRLMILHRFSGSFKSMLWADHYISFIFCLLSQGLTIRNGCFGMLSS